MSNYRLICLVVITLGLLVFALGAWVLVLQNKIADLQAKEQLLRRQLEDASRNKEDDTKVEFLGFHDLSFQKSLTQSRKEGKPVMVLFYSEESGPSMAMEKVTWKDRTVQNWLQETTISIKINADKDPAFAVANNITGLPVMIFFMPDGKEVGRIVGYYPSKEFIREATTVVSRINK